MLFSNFKLCISKTGFNLVLLKIYYYSLQGIKLMNNEFSKHVLIIKNLISMAFFNITALKIKFPVI